MYAMGGNVTSALIHNYGIIVFLSILENVCIISVESILGICMSVTIASTFVNNFNLLSISNGIKKAFSFFWGFIMISYTTFISTQSLLGSRADNLSSKAAKMLAAQMIPIAGNTIGESLRIVGASIEYLRTSIGIIFIVILLLMTIPPIISIALYRLSFNLSTAIAGLLGCDKEGKVLNEVSNILGYPLGILSICTLILIFIFTVFAKCASPLT
jgi:hypothetical protein